MLGEILADDGEPEGAMGRRELARDPHQVGIAGVGIGGCHVRHPDAIGPFDFERRRREKERTGKIALGADAGLGDGFIAGEERNALGQLRRRHGVAIDLVHRAGDGGAQPFGRKARDAPDAGNAAGKLGPVVGLADAERSDDADAGDGDDRTVLVIACCRCHTALLQATCSISASPSPRQLPTLVTTTCDRPGGLDPMSPVPAGADSLPCSIAAQAMARLAMN